MLILGYVTLYLLLLKFVATKAQISTQKELPEMKNHEFSPEETLFPENGPVFIHKYKTTEQLLRASPNKKSDKTNIQRRFGSQEDIPKFVPRAYDSFPDVLKLQNHISDVSNIPERRSKHRGLFTLPVDIGKAKGIEGIDYRPRGYDETSFDKARRIRLEPQEPFPFKVANLYPDIYGIPTTTEANININNYLINKTYFNIDTPVLTTDDRLSTMTKAYLYALYTITRIVMKNNKTQTQSTLPFSNLQSIKKCTSTSQKPTVFSDHTEMRPITVGENTETESPYTLNVYDYVLNYTPPTTHTVVVNVSILRTPLRYKLDFKQTPGDAVLGSINERNRQHQESRNVGANLPKKGKNILRPLLSQNSNTPQYFINKMKRSFKPLINNAYVPSFKPVNLGGNNNYNRNHLAKKQVQALNKAKEDIFRYPLPTTGNNMINKPFKYATPIVQEYDKGITETEFPYPWITTVSPFPLFPAALGTNKPILRDRNPNLYPWMPTEISTEKKNQLVSSTPPMVYEYKEIKEEYKEVTPDEEKSAETTNIFDEIETIRKEIRQKAQLDDLESKLDDRLTTVGHEAGNDPFSVFLVKLTKILADKNLKDLKELVDSFNRYVVMLLDNGKLIRLGLSTGSYIEQATARLKAPIKEIQKQIGIIQITLLNRRVMLDDDFNAMLDELDDVYDVGEEEAMQSVLHETKLFPGGSMTGEQIVKGFIDDVLLHPMNRIAKTAHGNVVFENIAKVANKYNPPYEKDARRDLKFIQPQIFREDVDLSEEARSKLKRPAYTQNEYRYTIRRKNILRSDIMDLSKEASETVIPTYAKNVRYTIKNRNKNILKSEVNDIMDGSKEDSKSDGKKVEIKIQINNIRHVDPPKKNYRAVRDFRRYEIHSNSRPSDYEEILKHESTKAETNIKMNDKTKLKLRFDCEPLPFIVSNKSNPNRKNGTKGIESKMIMYCNNANDK